MGIRGERRRTGPDRPGRIDTLGQIEAQFLQAVVDGYLGELPQDIHPNQHCRSIAQPPHIEDLKIGDHERAVGEAQLRQADLVDYGDVAEDFAARDVGQRDGID